ncbi:MAG TPA: hypothetical protein DCZ49_06570 [Hyphomonadaceae bacterium]|nr:hypothetical protein [Hyphomonadaceae bacterium]
MTIRILIQIGLFLTPFLVYAAMRTILDRDRSDDHIPPPWPLQGLALGGAALALAAQFVFVLTQPSHRDEVYIPPRMVDGQLQPGKYVPAESDEAKARRAGETAR